MSAYKAALHASDTDAAMPLYMTDGVFIPSTVAGLVQVAPDRAFVRTMVN